MPVLTVHDVTKIFTSGLWPFQKKRQFCAVNNISFSVSKGEIVGLLGPNGAGKTTTIQMLLGTLIPSSGSISYFGKNFKDYRIAALKKIGYASGYDRLPARLTLIENLDIVGRIYGLDQATRYKRMEELLKSFKIWEKCNQATGSLSAGQMTRLLLAKAFLGNPEIVLLDEPTASLDPDVAHEIRSFILNQREQRGVSLLITSHNMDEVTSLCDRVLVLKQGCIIADDSPIALATSISKVRIHLMIAHGLENTLAYIESIPLAYKVEGAMLTIEIDEHSIADFMAGLSERAIKYTQITIDKPTLEDYFLSVAKESA